MNYQAGLGRPIHSGPLARRGARVVPRPARGTRCCALSAAPASGVVRQRSRSSDAIVTAKAPSPS